MPTSVAIRLAVEGGAELKRTLEETGRAGETAFRQVGTAADQATAATDRLADKTREAAQAGQTVRPPAAAPASPSAVPPAAPTARSPAPGVTPSAAALREAERVRYRLDTEARNTVQLERDAAAIGRAEASGVYTSAYATHLRELSAKKYGTGNDNKAGLDPNLRQGLTYQSFDVFTTLYGGMSPALVAAQQGPQVAQTLMAGDGIKNNLAAIGRSALGLVTPMTVAATATAALGAAFIVAASQAGSGRAELERAQQGIGRATGATVGDLEMLARANTGAGRISTGTAREITAAYAGTGAIALPTVDRLTRSTADFARLTGSDIPTATAQLAAMFADPARGADQLAKAIGGVDDRTRQFIRTQAEAGNTAGAQAAMAQALDRTLQDNTRTLTGLAAGWENATSKASQYWEAAKRKAGQITGTAPETAEEVVARLRAEIENTNRTRAFSGLGPLELGSRQRREFDAAELIADTQRREARAKAADEAANRASTTAGDLARSLDPMGQQLRALEAQRAQLEKALTDPLARNKLADVKQVEEAFERVKRQIADMREDMENFGTTAVANLNRAADFALKTVGYTPTGRAAAEAQRVYEDGLTTARTDAEREGLRAVRDKELERARREAATSEIGRGGAFSRMSSEVRGQLQAGASRFGRVPLDVLAAIAEIESRGNLDVGFTKVRDENGKVGTAYGLGQITRSTGADLASRFGIDRMNRSTMGEALAGVLEMKLDATGGDLSRAIMAYRGASDPTVNRDYLAKVMRGAGQMGDLSEAGQAREQDARTRALSQEREALRLTTEAGGRDRDTTLARIEAMRAVTDAQGRGIVVTQEYAAQLGREALERRNLMSAGRLVEYRENAAFERSQLGRTESEARGASVARSLGFDPDSERGRFVMETEGLNSALRTTKQVASEAFTGMLSDLRRGRSLAESFGGQLDRMADRLLNMASDELFSSIFKAAGSGGGSGVMGFISSLAGGSAGSGGDWGGLPMTGGTWLAEGGPVRGPGGPRDDLVPARLSNGEYVISAASVAHYGPGLFDSLNTRRFADGGLVGPKGVPREAFTIPNAKAFAPTAAVSEPSMNVTVNMQGSSGDPATDQAHMEATIKALRAEMHNVAQQSLIRSLDNNGILWQAGVRTSRYY